MPHLIKKLSHKIVKGANSKVEVVFSFVFDSTKKKSFLINSYLSIQVVQMPHITQPVEIKFSNCNEGVKVPMIKHRAG